MKKNLLFILVLIFSNASYGQDIHFSQIHASPVYLNPAMAGFISEDIRLIMNYKNQWLNTTANFNTIALSADAKFVQSKSVNLAGGILFHSDVAGDLNYRKTNVQIPLSVMLKFNKGNNSSHLWSFGMQHGFITQKADLSKVVAFENEPLLGELFNANNMIYDLSLGTVWNTKFKGNHSFYLGYSQFHLNKPQIQTASNNPTENLFQKFLVHGGGDFSFKNENHAFLPSFITMKQGPHMENTVGGFYRFKTNSNHSVNSAFYFGLWTRWSISRNFNSGFDAVIATLRYDRNLLSVSLAYDFTISPLTVVNKAFGGPEVSLIYSIEVKKKSKSNNKIFCPRF